jgi:hypothetical protein
MIGTSAAFITAQLSKLMPYEAAPIKFATAAAIVGTTIYVIGLIASFWLPEPDPEKLAD